MDKSFDPLEVPHDDGSCLIYRECGGRKLGCPFYSAELLVDDSQPNELFSYQINEIGRNWTRVARRR